ncbi:hypothetical protein L1887_44372 [Cichorium endivia]|nr:hypothetical protein L1887_44372 [Cichorium endivia]
MRQSHVCSWGLLDASCSQEELVSAQKLVKGLLGASCSQQGLVWVQKLVNICSLGKFPFYAKLIERNMITTHVRTCPQFSPTFCLILSEKIDNSSHRSDAAQSALPFSPLCTNSISIFNFQT